MNRFGRSAALLFVLSLLGCASGFDDYYLPPPCSPGDGRPECEGEPACDDALRDEDGQCIDESYRCTGVQLIVDGGCVDCPEGQVRHNNACATPTLSCEENEVFTSDAECVPCEAGTTAVLNECLPTCTDTQILVLLSCVDCEPGYYNDGNNRCVFIEAPACEDYQLPVGSECCDDVNANRICDQHEPGEGFCPPEERNERGECINAP